MKASAHRSRSSPHNYPSARVVIIGRGVRGTEQRLLDSYSIHRSRDRCRRHNTGNHRSKDSSIPHNIRCRRTIRHTRNHIHIRHTRGLRRSRGLRKIHVRRRNHVRHHRTRGRRRRRGRHRHHRGPLPGQRSKANSPARSPPVNHARFIGRSSANAARDLAARLEDASNCMPPGDTKA